MVSGVTPSGFKYTIDEKMLSDWRVIRELAKLKGIEDVDEDDTDVMLDFILVMAEVESLIFKDKGKKLEKHILKNNDGQVAPLILFQDLMAIFQANQKTKNSLSSPT